MHWQTLNSICRVHTKTSSLVGLNFRNSKVGNIMLLDGYIKLPKLKLVKIKQHREIPSHHSIKSCTISRSKTGKYYISILTEYEHEPAQKEVQAVIGLDFSMNVLFVDSEEGETANYPRFYRQALEKLAKRLST